MPSCGVGLICDPADITAVFQAGEQLIDALPLSTSVQNTDVLFWNSLALEVENESDDQVQFLTRSLAGLVGGVRAFASCVCWSHSHLCLPVVRFFVLWLRHGPGEFNDLLGVAVVLAEGAGTPLGIDSQRLPGERTGTAIDALRPID